jgi:hypothetical protein
LQLSMHRAEELVNIDLIPHHDIKACSLKWWRQIIWWTSILEGKTKFRLLVPSSCTSAELYEMC